MCMRNKQRFCWTLSRNSMAVPATGEMLESDVCVSRFPPDDAPIGTLTKWVKVIKINDEEQVAEWFGRYKGRNVVPLSSRACFPPFSTSTAQDVRNIA